MLNFSKTNVLHAGLLVTTTLLHSKSLFCLAGLCEDRSDICELVQGKYSDHDGEDREWWAFKPIGELACPLQGCPLYVWIDGTDQDPFQLMPDQFYMLEMLQRGFIAVTAAHDNSISDYFSGKNYPSLLAVHIITIEDLPHLTIVT